ncbi:MAG: hypothetical protein WA885_23630 [Phormidesmis sp.]
MSYSVNNQRTQSALPEVRVAVAEVTTDAADSLQAALIGLVGVSVIATCVQLISNAL